MEGIVISDKDTKIIKINEACVKLFNAPDKEFFIGKSIIEFLPKYELPKLQKSLEQQIEVPINYDLKKVDGTIFPTIASGRDMVVDGENVRVSVIIDLTKIKQQEQQLFTQSRMAQMGEMISMIAHQWRQPLTAISSSSLDLSTKIELESFDLDTKEGKQQTLQYMSSSLKTIDELVQNLTATIDDFRNFYKPNKKKELSPLKKPLVRRLRPRQSMQIRRGRK
jgi:PAS domain S-box-containing protein